MNPFAPLKTLAQYKKWHALLVNSCGTDDIGFLSVAVHKLPKEFLPVQVDWPRVQVEWFDCKKSPPDADTTVLMFCPDWSEPVWLGWLDGKVWRNIDAMSCEPEPALWTHLPYPNLPELKGGAR